VLFDGVCCNAHGNLYRHWWLFPIHLFQGSANQIRVASWQLWKRLPVSASDAKAMTFLRMLLMTKMGPLMVGSDASKIQTPSRVLQVLALESGERHQEAVLTNSGKASQINHAKKRAHCWWRSSCMTYGNACQMMMSMLVWSCWAATASWAGSTFLVASRAQHDQKIYYTKQSIEIYRVWYPLAYQICKLWSTHKAVELF
jgi:hypothetical protein